MLYIDKHFDVFSNEITDYIATVDIETWEKVASLYEDGNWDVINGKFIITEKGQKKVLDYYRNRREVECFSIINRGNLWYANLTEEQILELDKWYKAWLDVTETKIIPDKPEWLK